MTVHIIQLNMHNCRQASTELINQLDQHENVIALLQEPHTNKNKIARKMKNHNVFPANITKPRCAVVISKELNFIEVSQLSTSFCTVAARMVKNRKIMVASMYMHQESEIISESLRKLIEYSNDNKFESRSLTLGERTSSASEQPVVVRSALLIFAHLAANKCSGLLGLLLLRAKTSR